MPRKNGRKADELRAIRITKDYIKTTPGSCLVEFGETKVICTAVIEEGVPLFLKGTGTGWLTAEYGMLPGSCEARVARNKTSGRTFEIQRLIGRSLRSVMDFNLLGERTIKIDCDVIQADGGTRTASITGGYVALVCLLKKFKYEARWKDLPLKDSVAAVSVGVLKGQTLLDLDFEEDSKADMDMNVTMRGNGDFIDVQATAEGEPFSKDTMNAALDSAKKGIEKLFDIQAQALEG